MQTTLTHRFHYVDLAKGVGISMVLLVHAFPGHLLFLYLGLVPIFFFVSGYLFSKSDSLATYLKKRVNGLVVPLLFFFLVSIAIQLLISAISHNFDNLRPENLFNEHISVNGPLWFLVCLLVVSLIYYPIALIKNKLVQIVLIYLLSITGFLLNLYKIDLPFYIDSAFSSLLYFHVGVLTRKYAGIEAIQQKSKALIFALLLLVTVLLAQFHQMVDLRDNEIGSNYLLFLFSTFSMIFTIYFFSHWVEKISIINWMGRNSLVLLCLQEPILRIVFYFMGWNIRGGMVGFVVVLLCCYPATIVLNRYFPTLIGNKPLLRISKK